MGTADPRPNLKKRIVPRMQPYGNRQPIMRPQSSGNRLGDRVNYGGYRGYRGTTQRPRNSGPYGGSSNAQAAAALRDLKDRTARSLGPYNPPTSGLRFPRRSPEELQRARTSNLCYNCMKPGHMSRDCPEKRTQARQTDILRKETRLQEAKKEANLVTDRAPNDFAAPRTYRDMQQLLDNLEVASRQDREPREEHQAGFVVWGEDSWGTSSSDVERPSEPEHEICTDEETAEETSESGEETPAVMATQIEPDTREECRVEVEWDESSPTLELKAIGEVPSQKEDAQTIEEATVEVARMNVNKCLNVQAPQPAPCGAEDYLDQEMGYGEVTLSDQVDKAEVTREILAKISAKIESAVKDNIIDAEQGARLGDLLCNNVEAFGLKQSVCSMSDLTEMSVRLKPGVVPFQAEPRSMGPVRRKP